jgi:hypothetical protein
MTWKKEHVMDREKNHIPLVNKKTKLWGGGKKVKSREDKRLDENQEDSKFQRNSKLGQSQP